MKELPIQIRDKIRKLYGLSENAKIWVDDSDYKHQPKIFAEDPDTKFAAYNVGYYRPGNRWAIGNPIRDFTMSDHLGTPYSLCFPQWLELEDNTRRLHEGIKANCIPTVEEMTKILDALTIIFNEGIECDPCKEAVEVMDDYRESCLHCTQALWELIRGRVGIGRPHDLMDYIKGREVDYEF